MCAKKIETAEGLLMPKATAVWLVENTALTFEQIGAVTGLHPIEVQALADEDVGRGIVGRNPVEHHELMQEELDKATADDSYRMKLAKSDLPGIKVRSKGPKYTPVAKRSDKPDAVAYILKHHPEVSMAQICKLCGTTKPTIESIRDRTHPNASALKPRHPVDIGLCTYAELDYAIKKGLRAQGKTDEEIKEQKNKMFESQEKREVVPDDRMSGFDFSNFLGGSKTSENNGS